MEIGIWKLYMLLWLWSDTKLIYIMQYQSECFKFQHYFRPVIPAQVIDTQRCLGVQECPNGCDTQMWYWEVEEHLK